MRVLFLLSIFLMTPARASLAAQQGRAEDGQTPSGSATSPYHSEDEWIVGQTARAVVDLARFVDSGSPAPLSELAVSGVATDRSNPRRFALEIGSRHIDLPVETHVWDPFLYVALARQAGVSQVKPGRSAPDDVVAALTDPTAATLQAQNETISSALAMDPRNPAAHEAAAFLLTTLALREASGYFYDPRLVMSRAAAHLAVAHALRAAGAELSPAGQLADLTLQVLAGRPGPAVRRMDFLANSNQPPAMQAWIRTLKRRATLDWRVKPGAGAPLIERLEFMSALAKMLTTSESLDYLETGESEDVPDWGWRTLALPNTVEDGHVFVKSTFAATLAEAATMLRIPEANAPAAFTAALSAEPAISSVDRTSPRHVRVIDEGTWGAFYERHLAHVTSRGSDFYRDMYGSKDAASDFETIADRTVGDVPLWPIVRRLRARNAKEYAWAMPGAIALLRERPDALSYRAWHKALDVPEDVPRIAAPAIGTWFRTVFPSGTAFEPERLGVQIAIDADVRAQVEGLRALSPWEPAITTAWSRVRCQQRCMPDQERANYALIADYHLETMRRFAYLGSDPVKSLQGLCDVSADECYLLSDWLLGRDRFEEAAEAEETYVRTARDRVGVSNRIEWLVRYYQRSGRIEDARRIAELAADVRSARGWSALAGFEDRAGNPERAVDIYRQIYAWYDDGRDLLAFYLRRSSLTGKTPDAPEYATLMERYIGDELRPAASASPTTPPERGLRVTRTTWWNERAGFHAGDIVTAVDGIEIWVPNQYRVLYDRSFDAPLRFTVWRLDGYLTIEGPFRQHYYGVDLEPYIGQ